MRIISKYKDYYDSAQAYGAEPFVFKRDPQEEWVGGSELGEDCRLNVIQPRGMNFVISPRVTFFCGKVYKSLEVVSTSYSHEEGEDFKAFFNFEEFEEFIAEKIADDDILKASYERKMSSADFSFMYKMCFARQEFKRFFEWDNFPLSADEIHHKFGAPIISYGFVSNFIKYFMGYESYRDREGKWCTRIAKPEELRVGHPPQRGNFMLRSVNPILKLYGFQKVFPPFEANQEISMYVGGVLSNIENNMVQIDDKHMRDAKGFNDMSFKKEPTKKRG